MNKPNPSDRETPKESGLGGDKMGDISCTSSIPSEIAGKPDPGLPGGPTTSEPGEGGKGGATGEKTDGKGGTDVATSGGATGTNVEPIGPSKPVPKPVTPKPSRDNGGPGTPPSQKEEVSCLFLSLKRPCLKGQNITFDIVLCYI